MTFKEAIDNLFDNKKIKSSIKRIELEAKDGSDLAKAILGAEVFNNGFKAPKKEALKWLESYVKSYKPGSKWGLFYLILGECYLYGDGCKKNFKKAFAYISIGAKYKWSASINCLADFYFEGIGTKRSYPLALKWYKIAEKNKIEPVSVLRMGYIYYYGLGTKKNNKKAISYYKKAAKLGLSEGKNNLNRMKLTGEY